MNKPAEREADRRMAESIDVSKFYRALATLANNALFRVNGQKDVNKRIARVADEAKRLIAHANKDGNHKCPPGQIWDEALGRCVELIPD